MNVTELVVFIIYFVFMVGIGIYFFAKSKGDNEKDYFLGGRQMGPVSYTHLDVYKRQPVFIGLLLAMALPA